MAEAEAEKTKIAAEAYKQAAGLKAEGDAQAMRIYADALRPGRALLQVPAHPPDLRDRARRADHPVPAGRRRGLPDFAGRPSRSRPQAGHAGAARSPRGRGAGACRGRAMNEAAPGARPAGRWRPSPRQVLYALGGLLLLLLAVDLGSGFTSSAPTSGRSSAGSARSPPGSGPACTTACPWPVDQVDVVKTTSVMKTGRRASICRRAEQTAVPGMPLMTGDTNLLNVDAGPPIRDPQPGRFPVPDREPPALIGNLAETVLTETVARDGDRRPSDHRGGSLLQERVKAETQAMLDRHQQRHLRSYLVEHHDDHPRPVGRAGLPGCDRRHGRSREDAATRPAHVRKQPDPQGARRGRRRWSARRRPTSSSGSPRRSATADRFLALLKEYQKAPEITRSRLYLEAMERILPKVRLYVVDSEGGRVPFHAPRRQALKRAAGGAGPARRDGQRVRKGSSPLS